MSAKTVLCFGDSNTHGTVPLADWTARARHPFEERWTTVLERSLDGVRVIAEGQPGRTTVHDDPVEGTHKNGLTALPMILESHRPVDLAIVMLGTNDCKARFSVGPADIARSIDRLIDVVEASASGPEGGAPAIVLVAPVPITETGLLAGIFAGGAKKSRLLAKPLAEIAAARGAWFLDAGLHADTSPIDGIHLPAEAHGDLAQSLAPIVAKCLRLSAGGARG